MEIAREQRSTDALNLIVKGRLDAYWADHLAKELADVLRAGVHQVRLDLAEVKYLSSAGIGTLLEYYKQFEAIHGSFGVINPSEQVRSLLTLTKLDSFLISEAAPRAAVASAEPVLRQIEFAGAKFEVHDLAPEASLNCMTVGDPSLLPGRGFVESDCHTVAFPSSTIAVGLGAFGHDFMDCRTRFGEFLAVAGAAAYQPTDGANVPDYMVAAETFVPELRVLYCAMAEGEFRYLARFEAGKETGSIRLSDLVRAAFEVAGSEAIGMVIAAETSGLLGASLRKSPAGDGAAGELFAFPAVREWLSYSAERSHTRSVALIAGIAVNDGSRKDAAKLLSMLRPLSSAARPAGHFHAAAFSYRPLKKGLLDLRSATSMLFEGEDLQTIMHLISDTREISGAGESEFVRGACWIGPIAEIAERK